MMSYVPAGLGRNQAKVSSRLAVQFLAFVVYQKRFKYRQYASDQVHLGGASFMKNKKGTAILFADQKEK